MKSLKKFIRNQDIFGEKVSLNFEKKGSTFKTSLGGFLTLIFYMLILAIGTNAFVIVYNHSKDSY